MVGGEHAGLVAGGPAPSLDTPAVPAEFPIPAFFRVGGRASPAVRLKHRLSKTDGGKTKERTSLLHVGNTALLF